MKITYDREACQGHNRCYMLAAELFDTNDEGYAILMYARWRMTVRAGSGSAVMVAACIILMAV